MVPQPKDREELKSQCRAAFSGHPGVYTEFSAHVSEYNSRQRLKQIGFVDSLDGLSDEDATIFLEISSIYDKLESERIKKENKKRR